VSRFDCVSIDRFAPKVTIRGVKIQSVGARDEAERFIQISPQFVKRAGPARMVPCHRNPPRKRAAGGFEPSNVIPLPAVDRNWDGSEGAQSRLGFYTECGESVLGRTVRVTVRGSPLSCAFF
jgi:hypothetical protein